MPRRPALIAARIPLAVGLSLVMLGLGTPDASAATVTVRIRETLDPKTVTIAPGTAVRWVNESGNRYRMRSRTGPEEFDSGNLEPGQSFTFVFTTTGTYPYVDDRERDDSDFHGTIIVAEPAGGGPGSTSQPGATPRPAAPTSAVVHMAGRAFSPSSVTIAAGGRVTFLNDDDREHTATATGGGFDTGVLDSGAQVATTFSTPGSFPFLCAIHPEMTGTVTVTGGGAQAPAPTPTPRPRPTPAPTTGPSAAPGSAGSTVQEASIVDFAFEPGSLDIVAGTTIRWTNAGAAPHTVTAEDGTFDSGTIAAGATFERRFDAAGTVAFVCAFHPGMTGTIWVAAAGSPGSGGSAGGGPSLAPAATSPAPTTMTAPSPRPPASDAPTVAAPPSHAGPVAASGEGVARLTLTVVLVIVAIGVFGWLIRGTMRPAAPRSAGR